MFRRWLRACQIRSLHKGTALLRGFAPYRLPLCVAVVIRFSCRAGRNSPTAILHRRAAARMGFRLGMYGLFLLRILHDRAAHDRLHDSCVMIRRTG